MLASAIIASTTDLVGFTLLDIGHNCLALIVWGQPGSLGSTYGWWYLTAVKLANYLLTNIPPYYQGIIVGLILSDCHLTLRKRYKNASL
jgi:hypothetical protein